MADDDLRNRSRFVRWHLVIWNKGELPERGLLLMFYAAIAIVSGVLGWMVSELLTPYVPGRFELFVTIGLAASNYGAFHQAFSVAVHSKGVWNELINLGHFSPQDEPLARAYVRFFDEHGTEGRLRGVVTWAAAFWALYYGLVGMAILFAFTFLPILGPWTPAAFLAIDAPAVFGARYLYRMRFPYLYEKLEPVQGSAVETASEP